MDWLRKNVQRGPNLKYFDPTRDREAIYMSDFLIGNRLYEIKSKWWWNRNEILLERNKAKLNSALDYGFDVILVLDKIESNWIG